MHCTTCYTGTSAKVEAGAVDAGVAVDAALAVVDDAASEANVASVVDAAARAWSLRRQDRV